jgi:nucleotide-binding universal stress UspA family protein
VYRRILLCEEHVTVDRLSAFAELRFGGRGGRRCAQCARPRPWPRRRARPRLWRTFSVGFVPEPGAQFDAASACDIEQAAEQTAAHGAALAEAAGFRAQPLAVQGTPTARAVIKAADDHEASLIVLGSHRKAGLGGRIAGSIAAEVASWSQRPVMIVHDHGGADDRTPQPSASGHPSRVADCDGLHGGLARPSGGEAA